MKKFFLRRIKRRIEMKIFNFGSLNLDYVYSVPHFAVTGETIAASSYSINLGGKGLNQSIAASRAGASVVHGGSIGTSEEAARLSAELERSGVDISFLTAVDVPQGHAVIQVNDAGDNCIVIFGGSNRTVTTEYIDSVLSESHPGDIVVTQNEISNVEYVLSAARRAGCIVVFNASPVDETILKINYCNVDWLIINEIEGAAIAGREDIDDIIPSITAKYPETNIVLTLGSEGSRCHIGSTEITQLAYKVNAVDTTAAGDTFLGYFCAGLAKGDNLREIMRRASAASAIAVTIHGAAVSIPGAASVEEFLSDHG